VHKAELRPISTAADQFVVKKKTTNLSVSDFQICVTSDSSVVAKAFAVYHNSREN